MLFIVDDLTLETPAGIAAPTPSIDLLKCQGVSFSHAFVQIATCAPSRVSMLTGLRPDQTRAWGLAQRHSLRARESYNQAQYTTLAQHFYENGYTVHGFGKILHFAQARNEKEAGVSYTSYVKDAGGSGLPKWRDEFESVEGVTRRGLAEMSNNFVAPWERGRDASGVRRK